MTTPLNGGYADAAAAYRRVATAPTEMAAPTDDVQSGTEFAGMVKAAVSDAIGAAKQGEAATMTAIQGQGDLTDVVSAVAEAEITLRTVVAVRDKVVQAYQEIMRMPV